MTLKDIARLARSARLQANTRTSLHLNEPVEALPHHPGAARKPALQGWKEWVALNSNELPWIALVVGVVLFAGFYVRW